MNNKIINLRKTLMIILAFLVSFIIVLTTESDAASISASPSSINLNIGQTANISISTSGCAGEMSFSSSNSSVATISQGREFVDGSFNLTVTGKSVGTATITITPVDVVDEKYNQITTEKSVTITVTDPTPTPTPDPTPDPTPTPSASTNANLSNLGIKPLEYDFNNFSSSSSNNKYYATVPNDVSSVEVYAHLQDSKARYSVGGNYNSLQVGTNAISVTVTAEAGNTRTYTIYVTRKSPSPGEEEVTPNVPTGEEVEVTEEQVLPLAISTLIIEQSEDDKENGILSLSPTFKPDVLEYTLLLETDLDEIPFVITPNRENIQVEIKGNEFLEEGDNVVEIILTDTAIAESITYKIIVTKELKTVEAIAATVDSLESANNTENNSNNEILDYLKGNWLFVILAVAAIIVILLMIIFSIKEKIDVKKEENADLENDNILEDLKRSVNSEKVSKEANIVENEEIQINTEEKNADIDEVSGDKKTKGRRYL